MASFLKSFRAHWKQSFAALDSEERQMGWKSHFFARVTRLDQDSNEYPKVLDITRSVAILPSALFLAAGLFLLYPVNWIAGKANEKILNRKNPNAMEDGKFLIPKFLAQSAFTATSLAGYIFHASHIAIKAFRHRHQHLPDTTPLAPTNEARVVAEHVQKISQFAAHVRRDLFVELKEKFSGDFDEVAQMPDSKPQELPAEPDVSTARRIKGIKPPRFLKPGAKN